MNLLEDNEEDIAEIADTAWDLIGQAETILSTNLRVTRGTEYERTFKSVISALGKIREKLEI